MQRFHSFLSPLLVCCLIAQQLAPPTLWAQFPQPVQSPQVTGLPVDAALKAIEQARLTGKVHLGIRAPAGATPLTVYEQRPPAGQDVAAGARIEVLIYAPSAAPDDPHPENELSAVVSNPFLDLITESVDPRANLLMQRVVDAVVPAGPVSLSIERMLQIEPLPAGLLGTRWRMNWEKSVRMSDRLAVIDEGPGLVPFASIEGQPDAYRSASGERLERQNNFVTRHRIDGTSEFYDAAGRLIAIDFGSGNKAVLKYREQRLHRVEGPFQSWLEFETDAAGRVTRVTASNGSAVRYVYGPQGEQLHQRAAGQVLQYRYDQQGRLAQSLHPQSGATRYTYEPRSRVASRTWSNGSSEKYTYDDEKRLWIRTDPGGAQTATYWSPDRRTASIVSPMGHATIVEYDEAGRFAGVRGATRRAGRFVYDDAGRTVAVHDSVRGTMEFEYEGNSRRVRRVTDQDGAHIEYRYDQQDKLVGTHHPDAPRPEAERTYLPNGLIGSIRGGGGDIIRMDYDEHGRLIKATDKLGRSSHLAYDATGRLIEETDPRGARTRTEYDERGRVIKSIDPTGAVSRLDYNDLGQLVRLIDPSGGTTLLEYDALGRIVSQTDPGGRVSQVAYAPNGNVASVTETGHKTELKYDPLGNLVGQVNPLGGAIGWVYDVDGNVTSEIAPGFGISHFEYSATGKLIKETGPTGIEKQYEYDAKGRLAAEIEGDLRIAYEYDAQDRVVKSTSPAGQPVTYQYDEHGYLSSVKQGPQPIVSYAYDEAGRVVREELDTGQVVHFRYDEADNVIGWEDNLGRRQSITRDLVGRPTSLTDAQDGKWQLKYDPLGNLVSSTDPLGHETRRAYNANGELTESIDAAGNRARGEYDASGRLARLERAGGAAVTFEYDPLGNPVNIAAPLGRALVSKYDDQGRMLSQTDAKGQTTTLTYDDFGRLERKALSDGTQIRYEYDAHGRQVLADDGRFPVRMKYDVRGNRTELEYPSIQRTLRFEYDGEDRLVRFVDSEGRQLTYVYDQHDQVVEIKHGNQVIAFSYDAVGRRKQVLYPTGVRGVWNYDSLGRSTGIAWLDANLKPLAGWGYRYDASGNLIEATDTAGKKATYKYDGAGQLTGETLRDGRAIDYAYAPGGNRISRKLGDELTRFQYDAADQLTSAGDVQFTYDANGNPATRQDAAGLTGYTYDALDQLIAVSLPGGKEIKFGYAPTGERIWREDAAGRTWFVTDGLHLVAELDGQLKPTASYVHAPGVDQPLMVEQNRQRYFYHQDGQNNVHMLSDSQGQVACRYELDAFGNRLSANGDLRNPFQFAARYYEPELGLYYMRARYYDPAMGRFMGEDPAPADLAEPLSVNRFLYAQNNPLKYWDPFGTQVVPFQDPFTGELFNVHHQSTPHPVHPTARGFHQPSTGRTTTYPAAGQPGSHTWTGVVTHEATHARDARRLLPDMARAANSALPPTWQLDPNNLSEAEKRALWNANVARPIPSNYSGPTQRQLHAAGSLSRPELLRNRLERRAYLRQASYLVNRANWSVINDEVRRVLQGFERYGGDSAALRDRLREQWYSRNPLVRGIGGGRSSFAPPSLLARIRGAFSNGVDRLRNSGILGWGGVAGGLALWNAHGIYGRISSSDEPTWQALKELMVFAGAGTAAGLIAATTWPALVAQMGLGMGGAFLAGLLFDKLHPPGQIAQQRAQPMPAENDDRKWISMTYTYGHDEYHDRAMQVLGEARQRGTDGLATREAHNSNLERHRQQAALIDRQLTERERQRRAAIDAYNRALEAERARQAWEMQRYIQQQQLLRQQQFHQQQRQQNLQQQLHEQWRRNNNPRPPTPYIGDHLEA